MRTIIADAAWDGRRLTRFLQKTLPSAPAGQIARFLRLGRVKVDGKRGREDTVLSEGQRVDLYVEDAWFEKPERVDPFYGRLRPKLTVLYEDAHLLVLDKRPGLICHPDEGEKVHTLLTYAQAYLYQKGEWKPGGFAPALCNRIDRFTGGIVMVAKDPQALREMDGRIRRHEVEKYYLCIVHGDVRPGEGTLRHALLKEGKRVRVLSAPQPGAQEAVTHYRVVDARDGLTLCECLLETGRTHQIRAQFAAAGHPLLGDNQYGDARLARRYGWVGGQALCAYRLIFRFGPDAGCLGALDGKLIQVGDVPFVHTYFPEVVIP